jgi:hypothetical protein
MPYALRSERKRGRIPVALKFPCSVPLLSVKSFTNLKNLMHLDDFAFHAGDLAYAAQATGAIGKPLHLDHKRYRGGDLATDGVEGHRRPRHTDHLLEPFKRIARGVGVNCGHGTFVARIHRLKHVERLFAAALADNNAVGPHSQRIANKVALSDFALALDVGGAGLQPADVRLLQL